MEHSFTEKLAAWGVHLYSMLGLVASAWIAISIVQGTPDAYRTAFLLMSLATVIDATDGFLARKARVKAVIPEFDGRRLDDLIDFINYTFLPLLLLWRCGALPNSCHWVLLFPLLASVYGFSQSDAKTNDGYFLGFPSYWNLVAMYIFWIHPSPLWTVFLLCFFAALTFVPSRYLYATQPGTLNRFTNAFGYVWAAFLAWLMWRIPGPEYVLGGAVESPEGYLYYLSLVFPIYYFVVSWGITLRIGFR